MLTQLARKLFGRDVLATIDAKQVTADHWSENVAGSDAFSPQVYWLAVPAVQERHQRLACGGLSYPNWVQYCLGEFLLGRTPVERMLSIGCGSGSLERELYQLNAFQSCDAFDIASGALALAVNQAALIGANNIHYAVVDVESTVLPENHYDAVWFNGSLHHIRELDAVCENVRRSLKPEGYLFFNEYVGANHFAFAIEQREAITEIFNSIPERFRRSFVGGNSYGLPQQVVPLPDPLEVQRVDPSEAVRSEDILRVVESHFEIRAHNRCGGSILQFLLHGIAGNFREDDAESMRMLETLFDAEDRLIESGALKSDFVVVAATPRIR